MPQKKDESSEMRTHRTVSEMLRSIYGEKVYRLSLESGCTCPNRDGKAGYGGCSFCTGSGSGEFASSARGMRGDVNAMLDSQIRSARERIAAKTDARRFIAYFQSFTNTYGDPVYLEKLYTAALSRDDIVILSLGTRPDCLGKDIMDMLVRLNGIKPVWVELGLQTVNDGTAESFGRGYRTEVFFDAYRRLKSAGIAVIAHVIFGLPGETREDMLRTVGALADLRPELDGIKIHMLQVLKGTRLGDEYAAHPFSLMSLAEYGELVRDAIALLPESTVIHRITGDGPKSLLMAPGWSADKKNVLNTMHRILGWV